MITPPMKPPDDAAIEPKPPSKPPDDFRVSKLPTQPPADAVDSNSTSEWPSYISVEPKPSTEPSDGAYVSNSVPMLNPPMGLSHSEERSTISMNGYPYFLTPRVLAHTTASPLPAALGA